jgi:hydroxyacylglutathione hydrolase
MIITLPIGILDSNCYIIYDEESGDGVVVDAGGDAAPLLDEIEKRGITIRTILNTHGHFDHIAGNAGLASLNVPFALHPSDYDLLAEGGGASWFSMPYAPSPLPTIELVDGLELPVGKLHIRVILTPGHTPGSVCFYIPEDQAVITGDTLFAGSVGRTDLPGGDPRALTQSLVRLLDLPSDTVVYPGHGPTSTLARERISNPWLRWIGQR